MNQDEFLERYQNGKRDFSNETIDFSTSIYSADFKNINLQNSIIRNAIFVDTDFSYANLSQTRFQQTTFRQVNLSHSNIVGTIFLDVTLESVLLKDATYDPNSTMFPMGFKAQEFGAKPLPINPPPENLNQELNLSNPEPLSSSANLDESPFYGSPDTSTSRNSADSEALVPPTQTIFNDVATQPLTSAPPASTTTSIPLQPKTNVSPYIALSIFLGIIAGASIIGLILVSSTNNLANRTSVTETPSITPNAPEPQAISQSEITPTPSPTSSPTTNPVPAPTPKLPFQESCGSPSGSGSVWWAVLGPASVLSRVKNNFCGDAYVTSGNTQVASFTSESEANEFAAILTDEVGENFWVKAPRQQNTAPPPAPNRNTWQNTCGSPSGSGSRWWGVRGPASALSVIKNKYCGDALIVRGNTQAASFTSSSEAQNFANYLSRETGYSFWVSQPSN